MPRDSEKAEEISAAIDIASIDDLILDNIWFKLLHYKKHYSANISELARGLQMSRPVITAFLGDGQKRGKNEPKFSRGRILNLFAELTKPETLNLKEGQSELSESQIRRTELKKAGPDELLIAAGLITETMKTVTVSPLLEPQLTFISFLYENQALNPDLYSQIIKLKTDQMKLEQDQRRIEELENIIKNMIEQYDNKEKITKPSLPESRTEIGLIEKLTSNIWINGKIKKIIEEKYNRQTKLIGRNDLTPIETAGLLKSVINNQLNKNERFDLNLIVIGVEWTSLSIPWVTDNNQNELLVKINEIENKCESILMSKSEEILSDDLYSLYPVTRTIVKFKQRDSDEIIDFKCISAGTQLGAATSAISQSMGFAHCVSKMEMGMEWLGEGIKSLVSTTVTIVDTDHKVVSSEWVSSDLMQSLLQALKVAGNKWFYQNYCTGLSTENYKLVIKKIAELKEYFYECRYASDQVDIENTDNDITRFRDISRRSQEIIELVKGKIPIGGQNTFLATLRRIDILSQLYRLHDANTKTNHIKCCTLIKSIEDKLISEYHWNETEKEKDSYAGNLFLISARISLAVEKIAYNLSFGIPYKSETLQKVDISGIGFNFEKNLLTVNNLIECFQKTDLEIEKDINKDNEKCKTQDPGYDIYHSLGSYNSIVGRILFYVGDREGLVEAYDRFLKAACYFQRIGLTIKAQRSLALAGRIKVRLGEEVNAKLCLELSKSILEESKARLRAFKEEDFLRSINSRVELLQAENSFAHEEDGEESILPCLKALKGALNLGLNRHVIDILHTIYLYSKKYPSRKIRQDLVIAFPEIFSNKSALDDYISRSEDGTLLRSLPEEMRNLISIDKANKSLTSAQEYFINVDSEYRRLSAKAAHNQVTVKFINELFKSFLLILVKLDSEGQLVEWSATTKGIKDFLAETWNAHYRDASQEKNGNHPFTTLIENDSFLQPYI